MAPVAQHAHVAPHTYSFQQLKQLWIAAGGAPKYAALMAAIGLAESSGDPTATHRNSNGTVDRGLWQINSSHGWGGSSLDPRANAKQAVTVFRAQGPKAWSAYNNRRYLRYIGLAKIYPDHPGSTGGVIGALGDVGTAIHHGESAVAGAVDPSSWLSGLTSWAEKKAGLVLLYLTFTALAIAFLVLGGVRAAGGSVPRRGFRPPNLQAAGFPEGY